MIVIVVFHPPFNGCSEHFYPIMQVSIYNTYKGIVFLGLLVIHPNLSSLNQLGFVSRVHGYFVYKLSITGFIILIIVFIFLSLTAP